jgi:hypothetical protein
MLHVHDYLDGGIWHFGSSLTCRDVHAGLPRHRVPRLLFVHCECVLRIGVLIDDATHSALAMVSSCLAAVVPEGIFVLNSENENVVCFTLGGRKIEAREHATTISKRFAWLVERGLYNCVILREEMELDSITNLRNHILIRG